MAIWDITTIKYIINETEDDLEVENFENTGLEVLKIAASDRKSLSWWVPRANNSNEFKQHRIEIRRVRGEGEEDIVVSIWVRDVDFEDRVRYSESRERAAFDDPGTRIPGVSQAGGDRILFVRDAEPSEDGPVTKPELDRLG